MGVLGMETLFTAAEHRNTEMVAQLKQNGCPFHKTTTSVVAEKGNLDYSTATIPIPPSPLAAFPTATGFHGAPFSFAHFSTSKLPFAAARSQF